MADISRIASPMSICEEDLFDVDKTVEKKKKELEKQQQQQASFFIGSVDIVNERISNLNNQLAVYESKLAIDSQLSYADEIVTLNNRRSPLRSSRSARARNERDVKAFEGALSSETVFSGDKSVKKKIFTKKSDEPKLVELQQYPGFDPTSVTPLPHALDTTTVLDKVVSAQTELRRKPAYKKDFNKMFYSKPQKAIVQDAFWWFFLNKFHPNTEIQAKIFKRIAKRYIALFLMDVNPKHKNVFLMGYGDLLGQSIYSTFCLAFPQSWRQFDDLRFKNTVMSTCVTWVSGIQPRPGICKKWNYQGLEPSGMRKDESIDNDKTENSEPANVGHLNVHEKATSSLSPESAFRSKSEQKSLTKSSTNRSGQLSAVSSFRSKSNEDGDQRSSLPEKKKKKKKEEQVFVKQRKVKKSNSCAAGRAAEFEKCAFNLYGGSPLLLEYFQQKNMTRSAGVDHLVTRTQISSYPSPRTKTFDDVIKETSKDVRRISEEFQKLNFQFRKDSSKFAKKQLSDEQVFEAKKSRILSQPNEVGRLSTLITMDLKRKKTDMSSREVGVGAALQAVLAEH